MNLIKTVRDTIEAQLNVGIVSIDPENEDPQHELGELLPHLHDAVDDMHACAEFLRKPGLHKIRVRGKMITRDELAVLIDG